MSAIVPIPHFVVNIGPVPFVVPLCRPLCRPPLCRPFFGSKGREAGGCGEGNRHPSVDNLRDSFWQEEFRNESYRQTFQVFIGTDVLFFYERRVKRRSAPR